MKDLADQEITIGASVVVLPFGSSSIVRLGRVVSLDPARSQVSVKVDRSVALFSRMAFGAMKEPLETSRHLVVVR